LAPKDANDNTRTHNRDVYVFARDANQNGLASSSKDGTNEANAASRTPSISDAGRFIAFTSDATNIAADDTQSDAASDTYVSDGGKGVTHWVSTHTSAASSGGSDGFAALSADDTRVFFESALSSIVTGDTNAAGDLFAALVPGGEFAQLSTGVLTVAGSQVADSIDFTSGGGKLTVTRDGESLQFDLASVTATQIFGLDGNDHISGSTLNDVIDAGNGNDVVWANDGNDKILGGAGDDTLSGGANKDTLVGGDGNDRLNGNGGNDRLF